MLNVALALFAIHLANVMGGVVSTVITLFIVVMLMLVVFSYMWIYSVQSKFKNTLRETVKNAYVLSIKHLVMSLTNLQVALSRMRIIN